ncbi:TPA: hypothetical protein IUX50_002276, partial [Enterococcus faecalis]|nr:hypothetical protein [Enterococcus faecalis]
MTAEIGILNKHGVVLAADSAVTIGGGKVYNSARKLFTVGTAHSIGIMIYGNASLMGVPWEILIKRFSKQISMKPMNSTECYVESFLEYLKNESLLDDENAAIQYIFTFSNNLVQIIIQLSAPSLDSFVQSGRAIDNSDIISITNSVIDNLLNNAKQYETITEIKEEEFHSLYDDVIKQAMELEFKIPEVLENTFEKFTDLVFLLLNRSNDILSSSGLVIAGYGTDDSFPSLYCHEFQGKVLGEIIYSKTVAQKVDVTQFPKRDEENAEYSKVTSSIVPFAQEDVVQTVLTGIAPELKDKIFSLLEESGKMESNDITSFLSEFNKYQNEIFIRKMVDTIEVLQIDEIADVAETLVNLTGFKRKYTSDIPTVGGPIDVLAINLGEGPIWIKRKHYFDIHKNIEFRNRKEKY